MKSLNKQVHYMKLTSSFDYVWNILHHCGLGMWSFRKDNHHDFNLETLQILGISGENFSFTQFISTMVQEDREDFLDSPLARVLSSWHLEDAPARSSFEFRVETEDGLRYIRGKASYLFDKDLGLYEVCGFLEEVTHLKLSEVKRLERLGKMALFGEIASSIAHEINTPLTVLSFYSRQLEEELKKEKQEEKKIANHLEMINKTTLRMAKMITSMKYYLSPHKEDKLERVPVEDIVKDASELCHEKFRLADVELIQELSSGVTLECRPVQICQILTNLFVNAILSIKDLEERWIKITSTVIGDKLLLEVMDSGHGIPAETAKHIMKPFFTTRQDEGTGIGLSISKSIAEKHQGRLTYKSDSTHTLFVLELPLTQKELT